MAVVTPDQCAAIQIQRGIATIKIGGQRAGRLRARKHRAAEIHAVTRLTRRHAAGHRTDVIMVPGDPALPDRVHPVRSTGGGGAAYGHGGVASRAFHHHARMALDFDVPLVVIGVCGGKLRMG